MRVVVIGAGVVGSAVAAGLTRRGAHVTLLEERYPGAGTTSTSFTWVNSNNKIPEPYFELNHAAVRAHHALGGQGFFATGHLECAGDEAHQAELAIRLERLESRGYPAERITPAQAIELEPDLAPQPEGTEYVYFPEEAHVFPAPLLARLLSEARAGGARIETGTAVRDITSGANEATVTLADGSTRTADVVIACTGRWTNMLVDIPVLDTRLFGTVTNGFLASTTAVPARLTRVLTTDRLNLRPDGGGRLLMQALDLDEAADADTPPGDEIGAEMLARLPGVLTGTTGARIERIRVGQRAMPADGVTVAGFTDPAERIYAVATHSGITLAPLLADLVAAEVHGEESPLLAPFRPGRFTDGVAPAEAALALKAARRPGQQ
ncbi:FAD-binding oxidoreductase [Streptomyces sp. NPDC049597]|uniref:NAD(P)/FAD-dependent oxidoreductase n=1 Tax=Streptomyces sp. NPDC049597 TaxID=3155276 RepID=UPI00343D6F49